MSYSNFATHYRPMTFAEVVGQEVPKAVLKKIAMAPGISVRSVFLKGSYGSGKSTLARIFARALNCEHFRETGDVCNECDGCRDVLAPNSNLYYELDASVAGNVETIRALHDKLSFLPSGRRLVVMDEVHACVDFRTPIWTTDGCFEAKKLVDAGVERNVKSYNYKTGKVEIRPITLYHNNGVDLDTKWYKVRWNGGVARVTENHQFFIKGVPTSVRELPSTFYADCIDYVLPAEVEQILIGTLLGDSILVKHDVTLTGSSRSTSLSNVEKTYGLQLSQEVRQLDYLRWKESVLGPLFSKEIKSQRSKGDVYTAVTKFSTVFAKFSGLHNSRSSFKDVGAYLPMFGKWTWLVWYLDDGSYSNGTVTISCTNIGVEGAEKVKLFCKEKYGWDVSLYKSEDRRSKKLQLKLHWSVDSSRKFLSYISGLVDIESLRYKLPGSVGTVEVAKITEQMIPCGRKVVSELFEPDCNSHRVRYNFSVEETENYTLPGGLLTHNCSNSALNALLKLVEDGVPDTMFLFASTEDILPTLKSRSVCLDITTIPHQLIVDRLTEVAKKESLEVTPQILNLIASKSAGHMRDALSYLQLYSLSGPESLESCFPTMIKFFKAAFTHNMDSANKFLSEMLSHPSVDVVNSLNLFLKDGFTNPESQFASVINKLFSFFYSPVVQSALKDEVGIELAFRSFLSKLQK